MLYYPPTIELNFGFDTGYMCREIGMVWNC